MSKFRIFLRGDLLLISFGVSTFRGAVFKGEDLYRFFLLEKLSFFGSVWKS